MAPKAKAEKAERPTKAAATSDAPKAKRAPSPYILFCSEMRPTIKSNNPEASFGELGKLLGTAWSDLDDKGKAPFVKKAAEKKAAMAKA